MKPSTKKILTLFIFCIIVLVTLYYIFNNDVPIGTSESNNTYMSSRGILKSCNVYSTNPVSSVKQYDIDLKGIKDNSIVYVTGSAVPSFAKDLHKVNARFILVSGDCDESIPDMIFKNDEFIKFIESDKIICWFTQNCVGKHPKLVAIPIGLDYHTLAKKSMAWGKKQSPESQEADLIKLYSKSRPFYERKFLCYSNFHFNKSALSKYTYDRNDAIKEVPKALVFYEPKQIPRFDSWEKQTDYAFVLSPHGNGLDCHRTWEALCLGCIPIVKTSPIDTLYESLPVLIVNEWSDVTGELLQTTIANFKAKAFDYDRLKLKYWVNLIQSALN